MGLLRLLLAVSVVFVHCAASPIFIAHHQRFFQMVDGQSSVEAFYAISGFYMALVLNEKYKTAESNRLFWRNRALRIFPVYWTVCGLTLVAGLALFTLSKGRSALPIHEYLNNVASGHSALNLGVVLYTFAANALILGQEAALFFRLDTHTGAVHYAPNLLVKSELTPLYRFMLIVPAWTLSLELMFYILAPFLVRAHKAKWLISAFVFSCLVRFLLWKNGLSEHPWRYMFFPAELVFFLGGAALYFSKGWTQSSPHFQKLAVPITVAVLAFTMFYGILPSLNEWKAPLYLACAIFSIPALFAFSSRFKWDRAIGELSFPIYICHTLVLHCIEASFVPRALQNPWVTVVASIALAILLNRFVAVPVERRRQKPFARVQSAPAPL